MRPILTIISFVAILLSAIAAIGASLPMSSEYLSIRRTIPMRLREEGCTIGLASGYVTEDGRPIMWKVRDIYEARQQIVHVSGYPYDYIGVRSQGGEVAMGLNEAGVAGGNSLVYTPGITAPNKTLLNYILKTHDNLNDIRNYIEARVVASSSDFSGCFPFIDENDNAIMFEVNRSNWFLEYDSMDPDREAQGLLGFVVRANEFHEQTNGTDDISIEGRYYTGTYNVSGLVSIDELSVKTIVQGNDYANDYEFLRYGPDRFLSTISRSLTQSAIAVHGVASNEDPWLATMWVILGPTNYGIAVPTWVIVSDIPQRLGSGDMYDRARSLYNKGNEEITQASIFPVEAHIFSSVVNELLPHWRAEGLPSVDEVMRVEHRIANDAYSLLDCLDNYQSDNLAPTVSFHAIPSGLTMDFELMASDVDGTIAEVLWNFGDEATSSEISPSHTYAEAGTYLVSSTVTDDDGVSLTSWMYIDVVYPPLGHEDYCRDCGPCAEGEGDCDSDAECENGLVCLPDPLVPGTDTCQIPPPVCPPLGHADYCLDCGPCAEGEGDCDSDAECENGLVCLPDPLVPGTDTCQIPPPVCPPLGHADYCLDCGPCAEGEGDCDSDAECENGLVCLPDPLVPGTDTCQIPPPVCPPLGHADYCLDCGPCAEGEGDCDSDAECENGLVCLPDQQAPGTDTCQIPPPACPPLGHADYCLDCGPCAEGEGDCDSDAECENGLVCLPDQQAPGTDTCQTPPPACPPLGHADYCLDCGPCAEGEGDCDSDAECENGLVCLPDQQDPGTDICSVIIDTCPGDSEPDKDVDGVDLADYILDSGGLGLDDFAMNFGKINCP